RCAPDRQRPSQHLRVLACHTETDARTSNAPGSRLFHLPERLEDASEVGRRDADTGVAHVDHDAVSVTVRTERHATAIRELGCIGKQVPQHLANLRTVGEYERYIRRNVVLELDATIRQLPREGSSHL